MKALAELTASVPVHLVNHYLGHDTLELVPRETAFPDLAPIVT
jgi:hypothetical protein